MNKILVACKKQETANRYQEALGKSAYVFVYDEKDLPICGFRASAIIAADEWTKDEIEKILLPYLVSGIDISTRIRIRELEDAIRKHRSATGHDMCWENDVELWSVLKDNVKMDHTPPPWPEFMKRCAAYRASKDACGQATTITKT
jgi:hypothetical protein